MDFGPYGQVLRAPAGVGGLPLAGASVWEGKHIRVLTTAEGGRRAKTKEASEARCSIYLVSGVSPPQNLEAWGRERALMDKFRSHRSKPWFLIRSPLQMPTKQWLFMDSSGAEEMDLVHPQ